MSGAPGEPDGTVIGYLHGLAIKTGLQLPSSSLSPDMVNRFGKNYLLSLPQRTVAGSCTWSAPVRFLVDSQDSCVIEVTNGSCATGSQLDAQMYVPSAGWGVATGPLVLRQQTVGDITKTDVHFQCIDQPASAVGPTVWLDMEFCFATNDTCRIVSDCDIDSVTTAYVCPSDPVVWSTAHPPPPRCWFDDGFTVPPSPSFDAATGVCHNAVVGVEYNFTWSGQTITRLNATLTLANVSTVTNGANVTLLGQDFVVTFDANWSRPSASNGSFSRSSMVYPPSGNPGKPCFNEDFLSKSVNKQIN